MLIRLFLIFFINIFYILSVEASLYSGKWPELEIEKIKSIPFLKRYPIEKIEHLGGVINNNYKITLGLNDIETHYIVKITNTIQDDFTNRCQELENQNKAHAIGIAPKFEYVTEDQRLCLIEYIDSQKINLLDNSETLQNIAKTIGKLHSSSISFKNNGSFIEQLTKLEEKCRKSKIYSDGIDSIFVEAIKDLNKILENVQIKLTPCHNDININNIILSSSKFFLIDWEFSGQNDPAWDVAYFLMVSRIEEDRWPNFFKAYFSAYPKADPSFIKRVLVYRPFVLIHLGRNLILRVQDPKLNRDEIMKLSTQCFIGAKEILKSVSFQDARRSLLE